MKLPENKGEHAQDDCNEALFEKISQNLSAQGYSVHANALNDNLLRALREHLMEMPSSKFKQAGIGRDEDHTLKDSVRGDEICWRNDESKAETAWLFGAESLQQ